MKHTYMTPAGSLLTGTLSGIINRKEFNDMPDSAAAIGYNAEGLPVYLDIAAAPHILIAGTTGSGKSITMHDIIVSLLYKNTPNTAEIYLIDPKYVELSIYENIPMVKAVITDPGAAISTLKRVHGVMMTRYRYMRKRGYRAADRAGYKRIYIFIDELADLMFQSKKQTESYISSIARLGRAAGIHLIIATQRPTRDILTGQIKLNIPVRIALKVPSSIDSCTIIGHKGAETLRGKGDALIMTPDRLDCERVQCAFISDPELSSIINHCEKQR